MVAVAGQPSSTFYEFAADYLKSFFIFFCFRTSLGKERKEIWLAPQANCACRQLG